MELFELGKGVYRYYTQKVKGNQGLDVLQVQKKLTRSVLLGRYVPTKKGAICFYDNLKIVLRGNRIVYIEKLKP